jgi:sigma-E factor negative regulatory protein RseA
MTQQDSTLEEALSALMDASTGGAEQEQAISALLADPAAQSRWHLYHLAGDVMRSADLAPCPSELEFLERLKPRLAAESVQHFERGLPSLTIQADAVFAKPETDSANAGLFRWRAVAGAFVFGVSAVILWGTVTGTDPAVAPTVASVVSPGAATAVPRKAPEELAITEFAAPNAQIMIRDPELDALLAAHGAMGGNSALQLPSGFLRNATFERPAR